MTEIWPTRLCASGMGLAYGVGNSGKVIGPLGLALILGANDLIKPAANLDSLGLAFVYFASWYLLGIMAYWFIGFETKGHSFSRHGWCNSPRAMDRTVFTAITELRV